MSAHGKFDTTFLCLLAIGVPIVAPSTIASAQETGVDGYYSQDGINLGGFTLFGQAEAGAGIDDNIYALQANEIDDTLFVFAPELRLASNWSRHGLVLEIKNRNVVYSEQSGEDHSDWIASANGSLDASRATTLMGRAVYSMLSEGRGESEINNLAAETTEYDRLELGAEIRHALNRLSVSLGGDFSTYDYDDVAAIGGGTNDNDFRDRTEISGNVEASLGISPTTRVFARISANQREYDQQPPAVAANRDSTGHEIVGGLQFEVTELITGEVFGGYHEQIYDALGDVDGYDFGASLEWSVTPLTTINASLSRDIKESNRLGASGNLQTNTTIELHHELTRALMLSADAAYINNDFVGSGREDTAWAFGVAAEYKLGRSLSILGNYRYRSRESNVLGQDYDRGRAGVSLIGRF